MMENIFDEMEDIKKYCDLAETAKREGKNDIFRKAIDTAKQEMEHFDWQHSELISKITDADKKENCFSKLHDRQVKKYMQLKTKINAMKS